MTDAEYGHLTVDNYLTMKAPDQLNWIDVQTIMGMGGPILQISQSLMTKSDTIIYGHLTCCTDPSKSTGGGAVVIGHGWFASNDFPAIVVTDYPQGGGPYNTLWLKYSTGEPGSLQSLDWANMKLKNLYWSSGAYLTDNQGGSIELGDSASYSSIPFIDFHYGRGAPGEDYNVRLINLADCQLFFDTRTSTGGILPTKASAYVLGSPTYYWSYVYANYLRYHTNIAQFDAYDDLALAKLWGEATPTIPDNYDPTKTKPSSEDPFEMLRGKTPEGKIDKDFFDVESVLSFSLYCHKASAKKHDVHDAALLKLLAEVESLHAEVASLKNT